MIKITCCELTNTAKPLMR